MEDEGWNWDDADKKDLTSKFKLPASDTLDQSITRDGKNDLVDHIPVRGTRVLSDVYQRSNIAIWEPAHYEEEEE